MCDDGKSPAEGDPREILRETILEDHDRLGPNDTFKFGCHPGISCFNTCCSDVNIFLSPYDVLRMRQRLGMGSTEFLENYTLLPVQKDMTVPVVLLKMQEDEKRACHFVTDQGCGVYTDRPWPCRMYPVGLASARDTEDGWKGERFYFLLKEDNCLGHNEAREWTVQEWMDDQEVDAYEEWGEAYKELSLHKFFEDGLVLPPEKMEMFFNATYDLAKFRAFVFGSSLLERFEVDEEFIHEMQESDEALLRFGFLFVRFFVFGEPTMKVRPEAEMEAQEKLEKIKKEKEAKAKDANPPTSPKEEAQ
jgi:Fe-S-cluster containining protein